MASRFFGLHPEDRETLILEPTFLLMYYGGFLYQETMNMPVEYKRWFIDRISKELKGNGSKDSGQTKALHQNPPDVRALQGQARERVPSRLRRFT